MQHPFPAHGPSEGVSAPCPDGPGRLPAPLDRFVGREAEVAAVCALLRRARTVTVTGTGGIGKSRLARAAAARLEGRFADGARLVELGTLRGGEPLAGTVAGALGLTGDNLAGRPALTALRQYLADRELLLVVDGHEHLAEECARLVAGLLRRSPGLRVLAAGRRPLGVSGEHVLPLGPMPEEDAVELFRERAAAVLPEFAEVPGPRAPVVARLCRRLDGIPLALELAAGRLRALSVEQITDRLDDRFQLLTSSCRDVAPHHRTLRTAIGWSHELCGPLERLLWARLSVFAGDFDLEAAEYLCSGDDLPADRVLPALEELVTQSVVVREGYEEATGQARYRLLETVRAYGALWLDRLGETERLRRRHRDWFLGLATWCELEWFGPGQVEVAARVERELPNLRLALECALENPDEAHVAQYLAGTLWFYWIGCGRAPEGKLWLDRALARGRTRSRAGAKALWVSGLVAVVRGDQTGALAALHECRELAESLDDVVAAAYATQVLGLLAVICDDLPRARTLLCESLERFRALGELNTLVILARVALALAHAFAGETREARTLSEEALDLAAENGEQWARSYALYILAHLHMISGEPAPARQRNLDCLAVKRELGDTLGMVLGLEQRAALTAGEAPERAAELLGAAVTGWRTIGARRFDSDGFEQLTRACQGRLRAALGEEEYARAHERGRRAGPAELLGRELAGG